jgi:hypothetical protein
MQGGLTFFVGFTGTDAKWQVKRTKTHETGQHKNTGKHQQYDSQCAFEVVPCLMHALLFSALSKAYS